MLTLPTRMSCGRSFERGYHQGMQGCAPSRRASEELSVRCKQKSEVLPEVIDMCLHVWSISKSLDMKDSSSLSAECTRRHEKWTAELGSLSS